MCPVHSHGFIHNSTAATRPLTLEGALKIIYILSILNSIYQQQDTIKWLPSSSPSPSSTDNCVFSLLLKTGMEMGQHGKKIAHHNIFPFLNSRDDAMFYAVVGFIG